MKIQIIFIELKDPRSGRKSTAMCAIILSFLHLKNKLCLLYNLYKIYHISKKDIFYRTFKQKMPFEVYFFEQKL